MSAKKQKTKSLTTKYKLTKKIGIPRWIIILVVLIITVTGIILVYNSYAVGSLDRYILGYVYCDRGDCRREPFGDPGHRAVRQQVAIRYATTCVSGIAFRNLENVSVYNRGTSNERVVRRYSTKRWLNDQCLTPQDQPQLFY